VWLSTVFGLASITGIVGHFRTQKAIVAGGIFEDMLVGPERSIHRGGSAVPGEMSYSTRPWRLKLGIEPSGNAGGGRAADGRIQQLQKR